MAIGAVDLPEEHLIAIGRLAIQAGWVEEVLEHAIWLVAGLVEVEGRSITTHLTTKAKADILLTLVSERMGLDGPEPATKAAIDEVMAAMSDRNRVLHGMWRDFMRDDPELRKFSARGVLREHHEPLGVSDIKQMTRRLENAYLHLDEVLKDIGAFESPWPERQL